jgi:exosortase/archaeosortase family protein
MFKIFKPKNRTQLILAFLAQFLIRFLIFAIPLYIVINFVNLYPFQILTASGAKAFMSALGWSVQQDGIWLSVNNFKFFIDSDCTAWKLLLFFFALLASVPKVAIKGRLLGLIGLPLIFFANIVRITSIVNIRIIYGQEAAIAVHDWLWQLGLLGLSFGIWLIWFFAIGTKDISKK